MTHHRAPLCAVTLAFVFVAFGFCHSAVAQSSAPPDAAQLIDALKEKRKTRGLSPSETQADVEKRRKIIETLQKNEKTRGLSVHEQGEQGAAPNLADTEHELDEVTADRPKVDMEVFFDFNSALVTPQAEPSLIALGKSLQSAELKGQTFVLAGHTDATGSHEYNQLLSERRALAVKNYLISRYGVPDNQLAVIGYGPDKLKYPDQPYAAQNRRVEVVNMGQVALKPSGQ